MNILVRAVVLASAVFGVAVSARAGEAFRLGGAWVVYQDSFKGGRGSDFANRALADFAQALSKATGGEVKAVQESVAKPTPDARIIYVGDTAATRAAGIDVTGFDTAEYRIRVEPTRAFVAAKTGVAAAQGLVEFLRRFADYRYLTPDGDDPCVADPNRTAPVCDFRKTRAIKEMHNSHWSSRYSKTNDLRARWFRRMLASTRTPELGPGFCSSSRPGWCHTQFNYCPPDKYFKDHPEYYALRRDGVRHAGMRDGSQLCFTNPDVFDICYASLVRFVEEDRKGNPENPPRVYDFTHMDNSTYLCTCPKCRELIAKYDRAGGNETGGDMGLQLWFVNRLARKIRETHPDVMIRVFAYVSTEEPPKGIVPEDNVVIWLCDLYSKCDHELPLTHPFNAARRDLFERWAKITRNIEVWDYTLYDESFPEFFGDATKADAAFMRDLGIRRVYIENHYRKQPFYELNTYLQAELYADPDQDLDSLISDYCRVYGKGAADMKSAIDFLRKITLANPPASCYAWHSRVLPWRTPENMTEFGRLVLRAYRAEGPGPARGRIANVLASTVADLARMYKYLPGMEEKYRRAKAAYPKYANEALDFLPIAGSDLARDRDAVPRRFAKYDVDFRDLPAEVAGTPREELLFFDWNSVYFEAPLCDRVDDPLSETGKAFHWKPTANEDLPMHGWIVSDESPNQRIDVPDVPNDGKYHWVKIASRRLDRNTRVASNVRLSWQTWYLRDAYIEWDGMPKDPNWYDFWLSVRSNGTREGYYVDRLLLRRREPARK